jgi:predicted alpha/beta-fold hydrolase
MYSAASSIDLHTSLHYLRYTYPTSTLHGIGFSLGASVLSRYLGETGTSSLLSSGIVLACPWDIVAMSRTLETGFWESRIYSHALGSNLTRLFFKLRDDNPGVLESEESPVRALMGELEALRGKGRGLRLKMTDEVMVSKVGGPRREDLWPFGSADEYYEFASSKRLIGGVKV